MEILKHSYRKRGSMEFIYDMFPHSKVILYPIKNYYFIRTVKWNAKDPVVTRRDLETMEILSNEHLGTIDYYKMRKNFQKEERITK